VDYLVSDQETSFFALAGGLSDTFLFSFRYLLPDVRQPEETVCMSESHDLTQQSTNKGGNRKMEKECDPQA
jgi:hypothetical protein